MALYYSTDFTKFSVKVAHGPEKTPLDFRGNLDHVTFSTLATFYPAFFLIVGLIKGDCWALAEVCALLSKGA